jgi:hypothetical protein
MHTILHPLAIIIALLVASAPVAFGERGVTRKRRIQKKSAGGTCGGTGEAKDGKKGKSMMLPDMDMVVPVTLKFTTGDMFFDGGQIGTSANFPQLRFFPTVPDEGPIFIVDFPDALPNVGDTLQVDVDLPYYFSCGLYKFELLAGFKTTRLDGWLIESASIEVGDGEMETLNITGGAGSFWLDGEPLNPAPGYGGVEASDVWEFTTGDLQAVTPKKGCASPDPDKATMTVGAVLTLKTGDNGSNNGAWIVFVPLDKTNAIPTTLIQNVAAGIFVPLTTTHTFNFQLPDYFASCGRYEIHLLATGADGMIFESASIKIGDGDFEVLFLSSGYGSFWLSGEPYNSHIPVYRGLPFDKELVLTTAGSRI